MKKSLACTVLAGLLAGCVMTGAEADEVAKYKIDDGAELSWTGIADLVGTGDKLEVTLLGAPIRSVYGGKSIYGDIGTEASGNTVVFSGGNHTMSGTVYGGYAEIYSVSFNIVDIKNGEIKSVVGGYGHYADILNNEVIIEGGTIIENVVGGTGHTDDRGVVQGNVVRIKQGIVKQNVIGGDTGSSNLQNEVYIEEGVVEGSVYAGRVSVKGVFDVADRADSEDEMLVG